MSALASLFRFAREHEMPLLAGVVVILAAVVFWLKLRKGRTMPKDEGHGQVQELRVEPVTVELLVGTSVTVVAKYYDKKGNQFDDSDMPTTMWGVDPDPGGWDTVAMLPSEAGRDCLVTGKAKGQTTGYAADGRGRRVDFPITVR